MNNFNQMVGNTNMYSKNQSSSYFNPTYGATTPTNNIIWVQGIELINLNEVAAATELQKYIAEVDEELASATQKWLELKAMDWNICDIIDEQDHYYKEYSKKIKSLTY